MNMVIGPNKLKNKVVVPEKTVRNLGGIKIIDNRLVLVNDIEIIDLIKKEEANNLITNKLPASGPDMLVKQHRRIEQDDRDKYRGSFL